MALQPDILLITRPQPGHILQFAAFHFSFSPTSFARSSASFSARARAPALESQFSSAY